MWEYKKKNMYPLLLLEGNRVEDIVYKSGRVEFWLEKGLWVPPDCEDNPAKIWMKTGRAKVSFELSSALDITVSMRKEISKNKTVIVENIFDTMDFIRKMRKGRWVLEITEELNDYHRGVSISGVIRGKGKSYECNMLISCEKISYYWSDWRKPDRDDYFNIDKLWLRRFEQKIVSRKLWKVVVTDAVPIWYVCEGPDALEGDEARQAFDALNYEDAILFMNVCWMEGKATPKDIWITRKIWSSELDWFDEDVYVFDRNYMWTYIHTHEDTSFFCRFEKE